MSQRAHPDDPGFQDRWVVSWWRGVVPSLRLERSPWKRGLEDRYAFCAPYVKGRRVVDVPCGTGWGTSLLTSARQLLGVDLSEEGLRCAQERFGDRARFCVGDMTALPLRDGAVDVVVCLEGIEHVPIPVGKAFVDEAARVLSPRGIVIVTSPVPDPRRAPNPYHVHEYEPDELRGLFGSRFAEGAFELRPVGDVQIGYYVGHRRQGT